MMKNYLWFFLGLLCPLGSLFSQGTLISQNQTPVNQITDQLAAQSSLNDPSIYVFQEIPNRIQGVSIDLLGPQPAQLYEIHLQEGNSRIQFVLSSLNGDPTVSFDGGAAINVSKICPACEETHWIQPPSSFTVGTHTMDVSYNFLSTIYYRSYTIEVSPAADGYFEDGIISTSVANRNSLTR